MADKAQQAYDKKHSSTPFNYMPSMESMKILLERIKNG